MLDRLKKENYTSSLITLLPPFHFIPILIGILTRCFDAFLFRVQAHTFGKKKKAKKSAKQLQSDVIKALACISCWQKQTGWRKTATLVIC